MERGGTSSVLYAEHKVKRRQFAKHSYKTIMCGSIESAPSFSPGVFTLIQGCWVQNAEKCKNSYLVHMSVPVGPLQPPAAVIVAIMAF